jgi:hypothetical protein
MFREGELVRKAKDLNFGKNPKNVFQRDCYSKNNDPRNKVLTPYDSARRENLASTYFGSKNDQDLNLMLHTKMPEQARFMKTCHSISDNIGKLRDLGDRNWSCVNMREDKHISNLQQSKVNFPTNGLLSAKAGMPRCMSTQNIQANSTLRGAKTASKGFAGTMAATPSNMVRVFSPEQSCYIHRPAIQENESQRLTYNSMKNAKNLHSIQVCGTAKYIPSSPFERAITGAKTAKPYTVSAETFNSSWFDTTRAQTTMNYESAKFNVINHGFSSNHASITNLIKDNPKACYKVKSIAEYSDLTRVTAPNKNRDYQEAIKSSPRCFTKSSSLCAKQVDFGKTYGPFFSLFKVK